MLPTTMRLLISAAALFASAESQKRWREVLLDEARQRILTWYTDPSLVEPPETRDGITLRMLKEDQSCGGDMVPVTYAEFHVKGARPIDVFNTMLDTPKQKIWNPQMGSVTALGDWKDEGARAWAVKFDIPVVDDREFWQWQVAEANFTSEEFWLVFSTQNNKELKIKSPIQAGATESQNCLGAYHITKSGEGTHVIITQHVNAHAFFIFPLHQVLKFFPPAWSGTLDFVRQMSERSRKLAENGAASHFTDAPPYMLQGPSVSPTSQSDQSPSLIGRAEKFPALQPSHGGSTSAGLGSGILLVIVAVSAIVFAVAGFGVGRFTAQKIKTMMQRTGSREASIESTPRGLILNTKRTIFTPRDASIDSNESEYRQGCLEGVALL